MTFKSQVKTLRHIKHEDLMDDIMIDAYQVLPSIDWLCE
jgi:hypothetical protein